MVFVSFAPRTVKTANINENTTMKKSRVVAGVKNLTVYRKDENLFCFVSCFAVLFAVSVLFAIKSIVRDIFFSCLKIEQRD